MKNRKYQYRIPVLIFAATILGGCSGRIETPYSIITELPEAIVAQGSPVASLDERIGIYDINTVGEFFLCSEKRTEFFYSIYDSGFRLLSQFGKKGRSDNEFIAPVYLGQNGSSKDGISFNIFDRAQLRYDTWVLGQEGRTVEKTETYRIPRDNAFEIRTLYRTADSSFFGVSDFDECKFFTVNQDFSECVLYDNVLGFRKENAHEVSQSSNAVRPDGSRIVTAYYNLPQLDIRKPDGTIVKSVFINRILYPEETDLSKEYFIKTDAEQDYIYALYDDHDSDINSDSILVFDWDGNLACRYKILKSMSFCVDRVNRRFVAVNCDQSGNICTAYKFEL